MAPTAPREDRAYPAGTRPSGRAFVSRAPSSWRPACLPPRWFTGRRRPRTGAHTRSWPPTPSVMRTRWSGSAGSPTSWPPSSGTGWRASCMAEGLPGPSGPSRREAPSRAFSWPIASVFPPARTGRPTARIPESRRPAAAPGRPWRLALGAALRSGCVLQERSADLGEAGEREGLRDHRDVPSRDLHLELLIAGVARDEYESAGKLGMELAQVQIELRSAHDGHPDVGEHHGERPVLERLEGLHAVGRNLDAAPEPGAQDLLQEAPEHDFVLHDQDARAVRRRGAEQGRRRPRQVGRLGDGRLEVQRDREAGALAGLALDPDVAAVLAHDAEADAEPEAGAVLRPLRREERVEYSSHVLGRDAAAVVGYDELGGLAHAADLDRQHGALPVLHRMEGIDDEIQGDLLELPGVTHHGNGGRRQERLDAAAGLAQLEPQDGQRLLGDSAQVEGLHRLGGRLRELEQLADDSRGLVDALYDQPDVLRGLGVGLDLEQFGEPHYRRELVVQLVRYPADQGVEQRLLLLPEQAVLKRALLSQVVEARADLARLADPAHRASHDPRPAPGDVECELVVRRGRGAARVRLKERQERAALALDDPLGEGRNGQGGIAEVQEFGQARVVLVDAALLVEEGDPEGVAREQAQVDALRLARRVVGLEELEVLAPKGLVLAPQLVE